MPRGRAGCVFANVEVVVVIAFIAWVGVKHRGPQTERGQQPRLEVVELGAAGGGSSDIQSPRAQDELIDGPDYALRVGVGTGSQVERLVLRRMDEATLPA